MRTILEKRKQSRAIRWLVDFALIFPLLLTLRPIYDMNATPIGELPGVFWLAVFCFVTLAIMSSLLQRKVDNVILSPRFAGIEAAVGILIVLISVSIAAANGWNWEGGHVFYILLGVLALVDGIWQVRLFQDAHRKASIEC
jgi:hypothetical protein